MKSFADKANSKEKQAGPESNKRKGSDGQNRPRKLGSSAKRTHGNAPHFDLRGELCRLSGMDRGSIGIHVLVVQTVISEAGLDMSRWNTAAHFASWLGLCPDNGISGDKVLS